VEEACLQNKEVFDRNQRLVGEASLQNEEGVDHHMLRVVAFLLVGLKEGLPLDGQAYFPWDHEKVQVEADRMTEVQAYQLVALVVEVQNLVEEDHQVCKAEPIFREEVDHLEEEVRVVLPLVLGLVVLLIQEVCSQTP